MIKACIFDLDGVIVDTAKYHFTAWRRMANSLGFDFSEEENEQLKGVSRMGSLNLILQWGGVTRTEEEKQVLATQKNEWYLELIQQMDEREILPGIVPLLDELAARNIGVALGSASKNAPTILDKVGLSPRFQAILDGNNVEKGKPDPEVFLKGAQALGVSPNECIVFEDAEKGIEAALRGGFHAIGIGEPGQLAKAHWVTSSFDGITLDLILEKLGVEIKE